MSVYFYVTWQYSGLTDSIEIPANLLRSEIAWNWIVMFPVSCGIETNLSIVYAVTGPLCKPY